MLSVYGLKTGHAIFGYNDDTRLLAGYIILKTIVKACAKNA